MIEKKIICDRCGKECEHYRNNRGQRIFCKNLYMRKSNDDNIDLCQECYDSLSKWMNAESEVQKSGHWIIDSWLWICDKCGEPYHKDNARTFKFCPNCGARMESEDKE